LFFCQEMTAVVVPPFIPYIPLSSSIFAQRWWGSVLWCLHVSIPIMLHNIS
jgi:hypothetical protein